MTQFERMKEGLVYDTTDPEVLKYQQPLKEKNWEFNKLSPNEWDKKDAYLKETFAEYGEGCFVESPLRASWGGAHVHFGNGVYANTNVTLIDDGHIYVGSRVLLGPNVVITTANHPIDPKLRRTEMQYNRDVYIEDNVWIGAGSIVLPGVRIGKNSVIGAGSVVTRDIPENVLAVGCPCRILREITEHDSVFYSRWDDKIDWENLNEICDTKLELPKFQY